jgi:hypothetical protein
MASARNSLPSVEHSGISPERFSLGVRSVSLFWDGSWFLEEVGFWKKLVFGRSWFLEKLAFWGSELQLRPYAIGDQWALAHEELL